ncbi:MAG: hypothetical protein H6Q07_433, partial [Acidobacteria bacterium]|nr:hypothetical protein [Acidobacteriota bacterium]
QSRVPVQVSIIPSLPFGGTEFLALHNFEVMVTVTEIIGMLWGNISAKREVDS